MEIKNLFKKKQIHEINEVELELPEHKYKHIKNNEIKSGADSSSAIKFDQEKHYLGHRQRVKEKILNSANIESMKDYEIIEAILMYSVPRCDTKPIAKNILNKFNNIRELVTSDYINYKNIGGIGDSSIVFLKLINELFCRSMKVDVQDEILLNSPEKVMKYCSARMSNLTYEQFRILFLNRKSKLIKDEIIQNGTIDKAAIFPKEIIKKAIEVNAGAMILVHNHPSGDPSPSKADIEITQNIKKAANLMDIFVYDHIIIGKNSNCSMKNENLV